MNLKVKSIKELIEVLNNASDEYYNNKTQSMTDKEWDCKYDELLELEAEIGVIFPNSPSQNVGFQVIKGLKTVKHNIPLLSLDKSKDIHDIEKFKNKGNSLLGDKLDGLTIKIVYENGCLIEGSTRGDGDEGYDVTHNVRHIKNIPNKISYKDRLVIAGEAASSYQNFNRVNAERENNGEEAFTHPRMLASGSMKQLDSEVFKSRGIEFIAFAILEGLEEIDSKHDTFKEIKKLGFDIWNHWCVDPDDCNIQDMVLHKENEDHVYPLDGMVITYDSKRYSDSLGMSEKFPYHSRALKWEDETYETTVTDIIIDVGRTGQISFKANFETVIIDGTEVSNATLHNPTRINELGIGVGAKVTVYKAGKIIPQVDKVISTPKEKYAFDYKCPYCNREVEYQILLDGEQSEHVFCVNANCSRVNMKRISHFVSKSAMDIDGVSEKTIETIMGKKVGNHARITMLDDMTDLYRLHEYKEELLLLPKFGKKKVEKLLENIEKSKNNQLNRLVCGLGIPDIGEGTSKKLALLVEDLSQLAVIIESMHKGGNCGNSDWNRLVDVIGYKATQSLYNSREEIHRWEELFEEFGANPSMQENKIESNKLEGLTFVVTGKVYKFENRKALEKKVESLGGKKGGSVSKNTSYLICNDKESNTGKSKTANDLGVRIITEEEFIEMIGE